MAELEVKQDTRKIILLEHPVTQAEKARAKAAGLRIGDIAYKDAFEARAKAKKGPEISNEKFERDPKPEAKKAPAKKAEAKK